MTAITPSNYPYLFAQLPTVALILAGFVAMRTARGMMLLSGLAFAPVALSGFFFGDYWRPNRLGGGLVGLEDILFCFTSGALAWLTAILPLRGKVETNFDLSVFFKRGLAAIGFCVIAYVPFAIGGVGVMMTTLLVMAAALAFLLVLDRDHWPLSFNAAALCTLYYWLVLIGGSTLFGSDFTSMWDGHEQWGPRLFDVPVEEYMWSLVFPATYALFIAWAVDARLSSRDPATPAGR